MAIKISGIDNPTQIKFVNNGTTTNITEVYYKAGPNSTPVKVWPDKPKQKNVNIMSVIMGGNISVSCIEKDIYGNVTKTYWSYSSPQPNSSGQTTRTSNIAPLGSYLRISNIYSYIYVNGSSIECGGSYDFKVGDKTILISSGLIGGSSYRVHVNEIEKGYSIPVSCVWYNNGLLDRAELGNTITLPVIYTPLADADSQHKQPTSIYVDGTWIRSINNPYVYTVPDTDYLILECTTSVRRNTLGDITNPTINIYTAEYWETINKGE